LNKPIGNLNAMAFISCSKIRLVRYNHLCYTHLHVSTDLGCRNQRITSTCRETQETDNGTGGNNRCRLGARTESIYIFLNVHFYCFKILS
jgi:hypothetical protein